MWIQTNFSRSRLWFGFQVGVVLWILSLVAGILLGTDWWVRNWRMVSEGIWLGLGIVFVRRYTQEVIEQIWQTVVANFGIFMYTVTIVWWFILVGMVIVAQDGVLFTDFLSEVEIAVGNPSSWMQNFWRLGFEALRLFLVGLAPVFGYRVYRFHLVKKG